MDRNIISDLEFIIERTPAEWKALSTKIKARPIEQPKMDLFNVKGAADKILQGPKQAYQSVAKSVDTGATSVAKKVGFSPETSSAIGDVASSAPVIGGVAAVGAAAAIYAGYKIYKNYISKAGVACKNSPNRRACELQYHIKGKKAQIKAILNGHHHCKSQGCYQVLDSKQNQLRRDIDNLEAKLSKVPERKEKEDEIFKGKSETSK